MYKIMIFLLLFLTYSVAQTNISNTCSNDNCHKSLVEKSFIHSPLSDGCESCHIRNDGNHPSGKGPEFELVEEGRELCLMCHTIELNKKVVHQPLTGGKCTSCHSPHSSNLEDLISTETMIEACSKCHKFKDDDNKFGHGPYMSDQCSSCHFGHQSDFNALLLADEPYLCFTCHLEKEEDLVETTVHAAFQEGCLQCHSPHTSKVKYMLLNDVDKICYECHSEVEKAVANAKVVHYPMNKDDMCVSCHSPHAGELENLLLTDQPNLCFNCHSENINNKEKYIDIYGRLYKKYVHKPIFEGVCTDCHLPHNSDNNNLLLGAFPKGNYTKPEIKNFEMCFKCHDSNRITNKTTLTDTGFRDGSKNLHTIHVMKKKAISCQSCHDMHGADNPHIIGNVVYFGKWEMPINFQTTETGGTCLPGCHVQYSYNREKK